MKFQIIFCFALLVVAVSCDDKTTENDPDACTPGENFKISCNSCQCGDTGKKSESVCTVMSCPEETPSLPQFVGEKCEPGSTFPLDCNTCFCPASGDKSQAGCTLMAC